jgi:hypothetical protein
MICGSQEVVRRRWNGEMLMQPSFVGFAAFAILYLVGWGLGSGPFIGLMASLSFGSTAFVRLSALGGSTPLIYVLFALVLLANTLLRRSTPGQLRTVFARHRSAWAVLFLMLLAAAGTIVLPRLFAGETIGLLPVDKFYTEAPLRPSSKNVTQGGYFLLGAFMYFTVSIMLLEKPRSGLVVKAFFALCLTHTACGLIDLLAKRAGEGDVFAPLRSANYVMLSEQTIAGFPRLTGAMPEASTFAMMTLACLCFSYVYWRGTGSRLALCLTVINMVLAFLSTSSTAYVAFAILCFPIAWRIARSILRGDRPATQDLRIALFAFLALTISLAVFTSDRSASVVDLMNATMFEKVSSESAVERFHFNAVSIRNFRDTYGLGVGLGSSRSSSWPIAVLAQLGLPGALLMAALVAVVLRGMTGIAATRANRELIVAGDSVCASAIGGLVAASISGGSADPGIGFFVALAAVTAWRWHA